MSNYFVSGVGSVRKEICDGNEYVVFLDDISYGQEQELAGSSFTSTADGGGFRVDFTKYAIKRLLFWMSDWSLTHNNKAVPISESSIRRLDRIVSDEINKLLDAHIKEIDEKKGLTPLEEKMATFFPEEIAEENESEEK